MNDVLLSCNGKQVVVPSVSHLL